ncbi:MAG: nickel-type superoxide dismutase maturation protease [Cyanobacteria bacterium J06623_1]
MTQTDYTGANLLPESSWRELLMLLLRRRRRLKVVGESMLPLLDPGDEILIDTSAYSQSPPKVNDLIVITHPLQADLTLVKRITAIDYNHSYFVTGDNLEASTDSRHWGNIKLNNIIGKVTSKFN